MSNFDQKEVTLRINRAERLRNRLKKQEARPSDSRETVEKGETPEKSVSTGPCEFIMIFLTESSISGLRYLVPEKRTYAEW